MSVTIPSNRGTPPADFSGANAATLAAQAPEKIATPSEARAQLNASIVSASISVSISSQNEPLALLLKAAITGINDALKPEFGDNALQKAATQDNTPVGTAASIVSISTGFFEAYKKQHAGENEADILKSFMATIRRGFEQGYGEARDILQGLGVLTGDVASGIDKTHQLVQQGYAEFEAARNRAVST
jgi:hypothetical protein